MAKVISTLTTAPGVVIEVCSLNGFSANLQSTGNGGFVGEAEIPLSELLIHVELSDAPNGTAFTLVVKCDDGTDSVTVGGTVSDQNRGTFDFQEDLSC